MSPFGGNRMLCQILHEASPSASARNDSNRQKPPPSAYDDEDWATARSASDWLTAGAKYTLEALISMLPVSKPNWTEHWFPNGLFDIIRDRIQAPLRGRPLRRPVDWERAIAVAPWGLQFACPVPAWPGSAAQRDRAQDGLRRGVAWCG